MKKDEKPKEDPRDKQIVELQARVIELTDTAKRLAAEFDNYRKRQDRESAMVQDTAALRVIGKLLPVVDSFELALKNVESGKFTDGMKLLYAQLMDALRAEGVDPISAMGKFNPFLHEALLMEESDKPEGTILGELQRGYKLKGTVLRHSKVKVAKGKNG